MHTHVVLLETLRSISMNAIALPEAWAAILSMTESSEPRTANADTLSRPVPTKVEGECSR